MRKRLITVIGSLLLVARCHSKVMIPQIANADLTCPSSATLESLVTCIRTQTPQSGSNGFVAPTPIQRADWRTVINQMLQGSCDFAVPAGLNGIVQV
jgi:hypothetical protein